MLVVAARNPQRWFEDEDEHFSSFHDQERVSRISGVVPVNRRVAPPPRIPRHRGLESIVMVGMCPPPLDVSIERATPRRVVPLLLAVSAFLMLTVALSFAHYL